MENIVVALLAQAPESQSSLDRQMAEHISPRPDTTPHRLTIEAARNMIALVDRAAHYKAIEDKGSIEAAKRPYRATAHKHAEDALEEGGQR